MSVSAASTEAADTGRAAAASPPLPAVSPLTRFFWDATNRHELAILQCQACGHFVHYPRPICNRCLGERLAPQRVSGDATLYSFTWAVQAFHPYFVDRLPYCLAVVELVEQPGLRLTTNIVECSPDEVTIGMELSVTFDEVVAGLTLPMFRPVASTRGADA
jgi:uncharacterized protein